MCQLTCLHLGKKLNKLFLPTMLQINSGSNKDGTGFMYTRSGSFNTWKTRLAATEIVNLGSSINNAIKNDEPIIAHVRAASPGIVASDENAHPFTGKRFCIAHNGRLHDKNAVVYYSSSTKQDDGMPSDSLNFLNRLEAVAAEAPSAPFLEILKKAMADFKGKFALLIYDSYTESYYVARGSTADLHISTVTIDNGEGIEPTRVGFIVNTLKSSLDSAITLLSQTVQVAYSTTLQFSEITELQKETLYLVKGNELEVVGVIKENPVTYVSQGYYAGTATTGAVQKAPSANVFGFWKQAQAIFEFAQSNFLTIQDMDMICSLFLGRPLSDLNLDDLDILVNDVMPKLWAKKPVRKAIKSIIGKGGKIYPNTYSKVPGLQYPWMLNSGAELASLVSFLRDSYSTKASG